MAVRATPAVKTFTIRFPGFGRYNEIEHARLIARHFGTAHVELDAGEATLEMLPVLARQFDEPIVDSSMIPTYLLSRMIREHCTVALGGNGGDELFGGYPHYNGLRWMKQNLLRIPSLRNPIARAASVSPPVGFGGRNWLHGLGVDLHRGLPLIASYFDADTRRRLMGEQGEWSLVAEDIWEQRIPGSRDLLQRTTRMDFENYLAGDIR